MKQVWGIGRACVDIRLTTADYGPAYTTKLLAQETRLQGGGACANCLTQVARLGGRAAWLGKVGDDALGALILRQLQEERVDTSHALVAPNALSPFNVAVYAGTQWRRVGGYLLPNCLRDLTYNELWNFCATMSPGDIAYCEIGEIPLELCEMFVRLAKAKSAVIMLDVDLDPIFQCGGTEAQAHRLLDLCDYLLPNTEAMQSLCHTVQAEEVLRELNRAYQALTIVTAGSKGAYLMRDGQPVNIAAPMVTPVDTVGAGDAFHGGVAYGLAAGWPIERAVWLGCLCGARNCLAEGARNGMLRADEFQIREDWQA